MTNSLPLWQQVVDTTQRALRNGALQPIETESVRVVDGGVTFVVHCAPQLAAKPRPRSSNTARVNPFLPYSHQLFVADLSPTHVALLNKFPVVANHVLIVTRQFEPQETALTIADFEALAVTMGAYESLGFYNSGQIAGASQPHRHLQVVPSPIDVHDHRLPIESQMADALFASDATCAAPTLRFNHRLIGLPPGTIANCDAGRLTQAYQRLLSAYTWDPMSIAEHPHNLLVTDRWMMIVPRQRECYANISLNAMAFIGSIFTKGPEELQRLRDDGPLQALKHCAQ